MPRKEDPTRLTIADLAQRTGESRRTIRYYIQRGLLPPPRGAKRGAWYDEEHENRLRRIQHLKSGGLSLEAISRILSHDGDSYSYEMLGLPRFSLSAPLLRKRAHEPPQPKPQTVTATHIRLDEGLELVVDSARAQLTDDGVARLAETIAKAYSKILKEDSR